MRAHTDIEDNLQLLRQQEFANYITNDITPAIERGHIQNLIERVEAQITTIKKEQVWESVKTLPEYTPSRSWCTYAVSEDWKILADEMIRLFADGFITIGGLAGCGKTSLLTHLALDLLKNNPGLSFLFYSLDDGVDVTVRRILTQCRNENIMRAELTNEEYQKLIKPDFEMLRRIVIVDNLDPDMMLALAEAVKEKTETQSILIGIDYIQLLPNPANVSDRREGLNTILHLLKQKQIQLAGLGGCLLVCLSQWSREGGVYRYRETSEIENQSTICADLEFKDPDLAQDTGERILLIKKNKFGVKGRFRLELTDNFRFQGLACDASETTETEKQRKKSTCKGRKIQ